MQQKPAPIYLVILCFAILYVVWGSTYFFIKVALESFPTFILGTIRFFVAGVILLVWCIVRGEQVWNKKVMLQSCLVGTLLLFVGNGAVILAEGTLPSSLTAIVVSSSPIWVVLLDKPMWKTNFSSKEIILGLLAGFIGVILLFYDQLQLLDLKSDASSILFAFLILSFGSICWTLGSMYSKYRGTGSAMVNTVWQMIAASIVFAITSVITGETNSFQFSEVTTDAWLAIAYLITFGSIIGYSAYVWLISVRPITQVTTYAYVNPVVAVILGYLFANETITSYQLLGLGVILISILMINISKYRKSKKAA